MQLALERLLINLGSKQEEVGPHQDLKLYQILAPPVLMA